MKYSLLAFSYIRKHRKLENLATVLVQTPVSPVVYLFSVLYFSLSQPGILPPFQFGILPPFSLVFYLLSVLYLTSFQEQMHVQSTTGAAVIYACSHQKGQYVPAPWVWSCLATGKSVSSQRLSYCLQLTRTSRECLWRLIIGWHRYQSKMLRKHWA